MPIITMDRFHVESSPMGSKRQTVSECNPSKFELFNRLLGFGRFDNIQQVTKNHQLENDSFFLDFFIIALNAPDECSSVLIGGRSPSSSSVLKRLAFVYLPTSVTCLQLGQRAYQQTRTYTIGT